MVLVDLFLAFFRISLFAIGGAYSFLPLIEKEVVEKYHWLAKEEFMDVLGMIQVFPGAISVRYATYTGYKMAGWLGVVSANLGNILSPIITLVIASAFYVKYKDYPAVRGAFGAIQLVVFAMIIAVAFQAVDIQGLMRFKSILIVILSFIVFVYTKAHPAMLIIVFGIIGAIWR